MIEGVKNQFSDYPKMVCLGAKHDGKFKNFGVPVVKTYSKKFVQDQ